MVEAATLYFSNDAPFLLEILHKSISNDRVNGNRSYD